MGLLDLFKTTEPAYGSISARELEALIKDKGTNKVNVIDVRSEGEFKSGHIPKATNINVMSPSFVSRINKLDKNKTFYIICASGNRSKTAASLMTKKGFTDVYNVKMGMMGYSGQTV